MAQATVLQSVESLTQESAIQRVLSRGIEINTVLDLGAANGAWSQRIKKTTLPDARFHLFEAQESWKPDLESNLFGQSDMSFVNAAVAETDGDCFFVASESNPYGGRAFDHEVREGLTRLPCVSIDSEVERLQLQGPFFIKFDIHGLEDKVLSGAATTLQSTELIMMEMLFYQSQGRGVTRLMDLLLDLGFHCVDVADPMFRPHDQTFWQIDMLFVRNDRPEVQYRKFE